MAKNKFDGVIETVHYSPDGSIEMVRFYERRGPIFSDHLILKRDELVTRIKDGKRFFTGKRIPYVGGSFELYQPVQLINMEEKDFVVTGDGTTARDDLGSLPVL